MARIESNPAELTRRVWEHGVQCNVVSLSGELDASTTALLMTVLADAGEMEDADVIVDMAAVTFADASTLGAIIWAQNRLRVKSHSLEIRAPSRVASKLLELCELSGLVRVEPPSALATWVEVPAIVSDADENDAPSQARSWEPSRTAAGPAS